MNDSTYQRIIMDSRNAVTFGQNWTASFSITDSQTQLAVRRNIKTLRAAHNIADRLNNAYGAVRYTVKREA